MKQIPIIILSEQCISILLELSLHTTSCRVKCCIFEQINRFVSFWNANWQINLSANSYNIPDAIDNARAGLSGKG